MRGAMASWRRCPAIRVISCSRTSRSRAMNAMSASRPYRRDAPYQRGCDTVVEVRVPIGFPAAQTVAGRVSGGVSSMLASKRGFASALTLGLVFLGFGIAGAQYPPGKQSSRNVHALSHLPLGPAFTVLDVEVEQELSRPYAYAARFHGGTLKDRKSVV